MLFTHPDHPGRGVRLGYCMNAFHADSIEAILAGLHTITVPLRDCIAPTKTFGVGLYVPAAVVVDSSGAAVRRSIENTARPLRSFLDEHGLDAFTFNAF